MAKLYDAVTRRLLAIDPPAWLACAGLTSTGPVRVIDSDVSTVTAEADAVFAVGEPFIYLAHFELQSSRDRSLPRRLLRYNVLLHYRYEVPVRSVAVLLRPEADGPELTDLHHVCHREGESYLDFRYATLRVWELDLAAILQGGLATLPLAPLTRDAQADPEAVVRRLQDRIDGKAPDPLADELWASTRILMGLKYPDPVVSRLLQGTRAMKDSSVYQAFVAQGEAKGEAKGRAEGERKMMEKERQIILSLGTRRFGAAEAATVLELEEIQDGERLARIAEKVLDATSWDDLLTVD